MTDSVPAGPSSSRISEFVICRPPLRTNMADSWRRRDRLSQGIHLQEHRYAERINLPLTVRRVQARQAILLQWGYAGKRRRQRRR